MQGLTPEAEQLVQDLATRHRVSTGAVTALMQALVTGHGTMAQFNHPDLGGSGQWMLGGMTMVGDMFNHGLKATVDAVCSEISQRMAGGLMVMVPRPVAQHQGQHQGWQAGSSQMQVQGGPGGFSQQSGGVWWPAELGQPGATGSQNMMRYAYFPNAHRLAVDAGGFVAVYDTLDHQIGGFSQQQGGGGSIIFTSQYGVVPLHQLPRVDNAAAAKPEPAPTPAPAPSARAPEADPASETKPAPQPVSAAAPVSPPPPPAFSTPTPSAWSPGQAVAGEAGDVFAALEKLGALHQKGILTDEEFAAKKAELLKRL